MTQISKYPISKEVYERIFDIFLKIISSLRPKGVAYNFLEEFLTPTEQVMLAKRLAIAFMLTKGYDYRETSKVLRVSTSTIGRISLYLKRGRYYKMVIDRLLRDEKIDEFLQGVGETVTSLLSGVVQRQALGDT